MPCSLGCGPFFRRPIESLDIALRNLSGVDALRCDGARETGSFDVSLGMSLVISGSMFDWNPRGGSMSRARRRDSRALAIALALMVAVGLETTQLKIHVELYEYM